MSRKAYPSDVSDEEWEFVAPSLTLMKEDAPQHDYPLREVQVAVDTLSHLLALTVTPANEQERAQVGELAAQVQAATGQSVELACVDQGYTGENPAAEAAGQGIRLEVVKLATAKRGFVLLPRRWVVERSFA